MARKQKTDHCVMRNGHPFCENCGESYVVNLPAPIPVVVGAWSGFIKVHENCEKTWTEPSPDLTQDAVIRAMWWYDNGERGISSDTIFANLVTIKGETALNKYRKRPKSEWSHPRDPSDFYRCHKLLEAVPEFREEMHRMKSVSPVWSALVDNWDKLTEMLRAQEQGPVTRDMYQFMKELGC